MKQTLGQLMSSPVRAIRIVLTSTVCVAAVSSLAACGPHSLRQATCFDPTDDCNWSVVVIENNTAEDVTLRECDHHCGRGDHRADPIELAPRERTATSQYGGISALTGTLTWVAVQSVDGRTLGCLVLDGHRDKLDGDLVRVTEMGRCGDRTTAAAKPVGHVRTQSP
jgi:hypothetical protein